MGVLRNMWANLSSNTGATPSKYYTLCCAQMIPLSEMKLMISTSTRCSFPDIRQWLQYNTVLSLVGFIGRRKSASTAHALRHCSEACHRKSLILEFKRLHFRCIEHTFPKGWLINIVSSNIEVKPPGNKTNEDKRAQFDPFGPVLY